MYSRTATQRKYNNKVYATVKVELPKEIVRQFKEKCKKEGVSQASIVREAMENFIKEKT